MGGVLTYQHEDGMNYDVILDDLVVGSCPQTAADVDRYTPSTGPILELALNQPQDPDKQNAVTSLLTQLPCMQAC